MIRSKKVRKIIILILLFVCTTTQAAAAPYKGYTYNEWGEPVPSSVGYKPYSVLWGTDFSCGAFKEPKDLFVSSQKEIYILDSGNNRIVVLDSTMKLKKVLDNFKSEGGTTALANPGGLFVHDKGDIYIADSDNHRVLVVDQEGVVKKEIVKPSSPIYPQHNDFRPQRVLVDDSGNVYVIVAGLYQGAAIFKEDGRFDGFFGSNRVEVTAKILSDLLWKRIMTQEQKKNSERYVPVEYTSFDIDAENFVYTCSARTMNNTDELKKLNPMGENIFQPGNYGDLQGGLLKGEWLDTSFVDIAADEDEFVYALDITRCKVFQYDQEGNLVFVFGASGLQKGAFTAPSSIDTLDGKVFVLDSQKANITVFQKTEFGEKVLLALKLYNDGRYDDALQPWNDVLKMDSNYSLAYVSIGKTYFNQEQYKEAMKYFRLGANRSGESKAFRELRTKTLRENFGRYALGLALLILIFYVFRNRYRLKNLLKHHRTARRQYERRIER